MLYWNVVCRFKKNDDDDETFQLLRLFRHFDEEIEFMKFKLKRFDPIHAPRKVNPEREKNVEGKKKLNRDGVSVNGKTKLTEKGIF